MKRSSIVFCAVIILVAFGCEPKNEFESKGFPVSDTAEDDENDGTDGLKKDSLLFKTKPSSVLLTGDPNIRLASIYKVNVRMKDSSTFIGSNRFHYTYRDDDTEGGNVWNDHVIPGFEALYGFNLVNISHYNIKENKQDLFFDKPVLIKTFYYPTTEKDTLRGLPINRNYFLVSAYNEDSNRDGFINLKDLRRFYLFNLNGDIQATLVPENYSVFKAEYDDANDFLYVFAQMDKNSNGQQDSGEPVHIFWMDLKDPSRTGILYQ